MPTGRDEPPSIRGRLDPPVRRLPDKHYENHEMGDQQRGHGHGRNTIGGPKVANTDPLHPLKEPIQYVERARHVEDPQRRRRHRPIAAYGDERTECQHCRKQVAICG
jgi:hypothetical protein